MVAASPAKHPPNYLPYAIGGLGGTFLLSWCLKAILGAILSCDHREYENAGGPLIVRRPDRNSQPLDSPIHLN